MLPRINPVFPFALAMTAALHASASAQPVSERTPAPARAPMAEVSLSVSMEFGGDELAGVTSPAGTYVLNAGDGSGVGLGVSVFPVRRERHAAALAVDIGYTRAGVEAGNGKLHTRRVPVSLMAQYHLQSRRSTRWQFGLGLVQHRGVQLREDIGGASDELDLDSSIGWRLAVGVQWITAGRYGVELDLHYESVRHELAETSVGVDASNIGLSARIIANVL